MTTSEDLSRVLNKFISELEDLDKAVENYQGDRAQLDNIDRQMNQLADTQMAVAETLLLWRGDQ